MFADFRGVPTPTMADSKLQVRMWNWDLVEAGTSSLPASAQDQEQAGAESGMLASDLSSGWMLMPLPTKGGRSLPDLRCPWVSQWQTSTISMIANARPSGVPC